MPHSEKVDKVLDPVHVPGRGAPKKRLQAKTKKSRSQNMCGYCKNTGHNRRKCAKLLEFACVLLIIDVHVIYCILLCRISRLNFDIYIQHEPTMSQRKSCAIQLCVTWSLHSISSKSEAKRS